MGRFGINTKGWKETLALAAVPAVGLLISNLWVESDTSVRSLMAARSHDHFLSRLPDDKSVLVPREERVDALAPSTTTVEEVVPESYRYHRTVMAKVTGYTPGEESCGKFSDGFTSTGANAWALWGVAADPQVLPYGTMVFIPGVGYREVDDTGSAMRKAWRKDQKVHIDLRFNNVKEARLWGVRQLPIHVFIPEQQP